MLLRAALIWAATLPAIGQTDISSDATDDGELAIRIDLKSDRLRLHGDVSSEAHEKLLRQTAAELFSVDTEFEFRDAAGRAPAGWSLVSNLVLRASAHADRMEALVLVDEITFRGVTKDPDSWARELARVDAARLDGMALDVDVIAVSDRVSYAVLCRRQFLEFARDNRIAFFLDGADLRSGALRVLDSLLELAVDCPDLRFRITGHTDPSGDETMNRALSRARADAVLDYLVMNGLPKERLEAVGEGSSRPLNSSADARARRMNRRVEFELATAPDY